MRKVASFSATVIFVIFAAMPLFSQECGPSCPVCSGNSQGALLFRNSLLISGLYSPISDDENGVINARYGLLPWLDIGAGYAFKARKPIWSLRIQPLKETENWWRPAVVLGTGSVQAGGSDQSVYAQLSKSWEFGENFALRISGGAATLIPEFNKVFGLAALTNTYYEKFAFCTMMTSFHGVFSYIPLDW